jgi:effector-binding domain-containing protein
MISAPQISERPEIPFVAIGTSVNMQDIPAVLPPLIPEITAWMADHGVEPAGPPFFLYRSRDSKNQMIAEVGVPVKEPVQGSGRVVSGTFPKGRYAHAIYTGDYQFMRQAHMQLDSWVKENNLHEAAMAMENGMQWGGRTESYLTDPRQETDPAKWKTEIALPVEA